MDDRCYGKTTMSRRANPPVDVEISPKPKCDPVPPYPPKEGTACPIPQQPKAEEKKEEVPKAEEKTPISKESVGAEATCGASSSAAAAVGQAHGFMVILRKPEPGITIVPAEPQPAPEVIHTKWHATEKIHRKIMWTWNLTLASMAEAHGKVAASFAPDARGFLAPSEKDGVPHVMIPLEICLLSTDSDAPFDMVATAKFMPNQLGISNGKTGALVIHRGLRTYGSKEGRLLQVDEKAVAELLSHMYLRGQDLGQLMKKGLTKEEATVKVEPKSVLAALLGQWRPDLDLGSPVIESSWASVIRDLGIDLEQINKYAIAPGDLAVELTPKDLDEKKVTGEVLPALVKLVAGDVPSPAQKDFWPTRPISITMTVEMAYRPVYADV